MTASAPLERSEVDDDPERREAAHWTAYKREGSAAARLALFDHYLPFSRKIAKRRYFAGSAGDIELAELQQLAAAGLLEALDRFDPDAGPPFRAYASRRIQGAILDGIAKMSEVREQVAHRNRTRAERVRSLANPAAETLPIDETMRAIADLAVGLALGFMLEGSGMVASADAPDLQASAYDSLAWKDTVGRLRREMGDLPEREAAVIRYHYLEGMSFDQLGALLGVSKGRISQIHKAAIERLRKRLPSARDFRLER